MLAAAVWHNVLNAVDVNRSGTASPIDALWVINEIARSEYTDPWTGELAAEVPDGFENPYYDVNCDGLATPRDALYVINSLGGLGFNPAFAFTTTNNITGQSGTVTAAGCDARLHEGDSLRTEITAKVDVTREGQGLRLLFDAPSFDTTSVGAMQDAFEVSVTDQLGRTVTQPFLPERQAAMNWSERTDASMGASTSMVVPPESSGDPHELLINLSHLQVGDQVDVTARLINNDGDTTSSVVIRDLQLVFGLDDPSGVYASATHGLSEPAFVDFDRLQDISSSIGATYGRTSYTPDRTQVITELVVTNRGRQSVTGDLIVVLDRFTDLATDVMHPDGILPDGRPFFNLTGYADGPLSPGESTRPREVRFTNPGDNPFSYRLVTLGELNNAPFDFVSVPMSQIEADRILMHLFEAEDPDGDELIYSVVAGPAGMSIDPQSGELQWQTGIEDVGLHRYTIRATDPHGLFSEQQYDIEVLAVLQNRPPTFVTDPVTEAIASSGFEITTVGVGDAPAGVGVISGFQGPRIATANAGEQTIGVYAGENNDRFDDAMSYSTGHPRRNGQWVDSGTTVDFGFPVAELVTDSYDISTYDHGDFNGDGYLDMVVGHHFDRANDGSIGTFKISVVLNDGNGMFGAPIDLYAHEIYRYQTYVRTILVEDVNADGNADILFAEHHNGGTLFVSLGNGDGSFQPVAETRYEDTTITDFVLEDIDGDGTLDLFGRAIDSAGPGAPTRNLFWSKGNGDGTFQGPNVFRETRTYGLRETAAPYDLSDLDGDGDLDFVVSGDYPLIQVFHNDGAGEFTLANEITPPNAYAYYGPDWLVVGDFTGDGYDDIVFHHVWRGYLDLMVGDESGVDFTYQEGSSVRLRPDNWALGFEPTDVDQDGDLDLVFGTEQGRQGVSVGLNDGTGRFLLREYATTEVSTGLKIAYTDATVRGALFGDYNSDGVVDVSYFTTDSDFNGQTDKHAVGILFGTQPGEFGRTRTEPWLTPSWTDAAHLGDFNGDGIFDILDTASDVTALGNGDGTFGALIPASGVRRPGHVAAVADYDNDGLDDVVSNLEGGLYVGLSNGDGTFAVNQSISGGGFYGYNTIDPIDLNLDGYMDFVVKEEVGRYFEAYLNDPMNPGTFTLSFSYSLGEGAQGVNVSNWEESWDVGDFTGDGIPDLLTADREGYSGPQVRIVVLAGDGEGGFTPYSEVAGFQEERMGGIYGLAVEPGDFATGDIDNDGDLDLLAHSYLGARVLLNDGVGNFTISSWLEPVRTQQRGRESWLVDFDGDGNLDFVVAVAADINGSFLFWKGDGEGHFEVVEGVNMHGVPLGIREPFVDWDNDGHLDLIYNTQGTTSDEVAFYMGRRDDLVDMIAVDLDGDGNEEVIAVQEQMERLQIFVGDNLGGLTRQNDLQAGMAPQAVAATDLDGDGQIELLVANRVSRDVSLYTGNLEDGFTQASYPVGAADSLATRPIDIEALDVTGDGNPEVFVLDEGNQALWIFEGDGSSSLVAPQAVSLGDRPGRFVLGDATGDGVLDAVITLPDSNRLMILSSIGTEPAQVPIYVNLTGSPSDVAVLELNDDGYPELAATVAASSVLSVHYGLGNNQFARAQEIRVGEKPSRVAVADADEDGRMDLVVSNRGDDTVSVIYNRFDPNEVYRYDSDAVDPDDDVLTYAIVDGPGGLIINSSTGELLWAASPSQVGVHDVTISADDGLGGVATQSFKIEVEPARENSAPVFATTPLAQIGANEDFVYAAQALDRDNHPLRYSLVDGPEGAMVHPTTGELIWDGRTQAEAYGVRGASGYINVPISESLKPESITNEGWFRFSDLTTWPYQREMFREQGIRSYVLADQTFRTDISLGGETIRLYHDGRAEVGRWIHVAVTYDAETGTGRLFIDGRQVDAASFSSPRPLDTTPGITNVGVGYPTFASIDNYRVWNYPRSESEIAEGLTRHYENEDGLVLDYRFEDGPNNRSVHDHSMYGNTGYRVSNGGETQVRAGLTEVGAYDFAILVEDGRGGSDVQSFTVDVVPELRGRITGHVFDDLNGDGLQNDGSEPGVEEEPNLEGLHLWIDSNGNNYPDPHEHQVLTDTEGNYQFEGLLPGDYPIRISPTAGYATPAAFTATVTPEIVRELDSSNVDSYDIAIRQLTLSQIRGQLKTESDDPIPYWKVFADLNNNGSRDDGEPMATSDRFGNYAVTGLGAGTYKLLTDTPAGWIDSAEVDGLMVEIFDDEVNTGNDFVLTPTNTSVTAGLHFVTEPPTAIEARQTYTYASVAFAIEAADVVYDLSLAPDGMVVDPATGLIAWRPTIGQVGEHTVILRATAGNSVALQDFTVNVAAPNFGPVITTLPGETAYLNTPHRFDIAAQDEESAELTFGLVGEDHGANVDPTTGRFTWTPTSIGTFDFTLRVTDQSSASVEEVFTMVVTDTVPALELVDLRLPRDSYPVGRQTVARVSAMDSLGRSVDWSIDNAPDGLAVQSDGTILWTPAAAQLGRHTLQFVATTAEGTEFEVLLDVDVTGSLVNSAPIVDSEPIRFAVIGRGYSYDIVASDADRDPLSFVLLESPAGMSIDPLRGTIRWTPGEDQFGESDVVVRVADTYGAETTHSYKLSARRFGGPPIIQSVPETEASVGTAYFYSIDARDAEADPLVYRLLSAPAGMTISESTGEVTWTPTIDQLGLQSAVIEVSDGVGGAATQAFAILVSDGVPNQPPSINNAAPRFAAVGQAYQHTVDSTDPESTALTYSLSESPAGMTIDADTGEISWTPAAGQDGKHLVTIRVTDVGGAAAIESFEIDVLAQNTPPVINGQPATEEAAGAEFKYDVLASDADLDRLIFELTDAPAGASVDAFGRIRWQTEVADIGDHDFSIVVRDPRGGVVSQDFTLSVIEDLVPPKLSLIENLGDSGRNILPWMGPFRVFVKATDNVEVASLTLQANGQDIPLDAAGTATFTFEEWTFAAINATATAIDTNGNIATKTITFDYDIPEGWAGAGIDDIPTAIISSPADTASVTGMVSIEGTADHDDFATYRLSYRRVDETEFTEILQSSTAVVDGELGVWDTSLLINDEYVIRLEVATTGGVANVVEHSVGLGGELKLGNFRLSFTDMVIPVAGIPIEITRIYDTLQADRQGDFGYGWRLEYRDTDLRVGLPKSGLEDIGIYTPMRPGVKVYLNIPGQGRQGFTFDPDIRVLPGWGGNNLVLARPRFTPDAGVTARLSTGTNGYLQVNEQGELFAPGGIPYNPASPDFGGAYVVTTREGITYRIDGENGRLTSAIDANGNVVRFDANGIRSDEMSVVQFSRDRQGRITAVTDPLGHSLNYQYSKAGDLINVTDRDGVTMSMTYLSDPAHYLDLLIDALDRPQNRSNYDEDGRLVGIVNVFGDETEFVFDPDDSLVRTTNALGYESVLVYDNQGNVVSSINELGQQVTNQYDANGNLLTTRTPLGFTTRFTYDQNGNVTSETDASGARQVMEYDQRNLMTSHTDRLGNTTEFVYDDGRNLLSTRYADGSQTSFAYDSRGNRTRITDAGGFETHLVYGQSGLESVTLPDGFQVSMQNDATGFPLSESFTADTRFGVIERTVEMQPNRSGEPISIQIGNTLSTREFNELGQQSSSVRADGLTQTLTYDARGDIESIGGTGASDASFSRDRLGQVTSIEGQSGVGDFEFEYDRAGRQIGWASGNDSYLTEYDADGRKTRQTHSDGSSTSYEYDSLGRLLVQQFDNGVVKRDFDVEGNETAAWIDGQLLYEIAYDNLGQIVSRAFHDGSSEFWEYDSRGNVTEWTNRQGLTTKYEYDSRGNLIQLIDADGNRTLYSYDSLDSLDYVKDARGQEIELGYDAFGQRIARRFNDGKEERFVYDDQGRFQSIVDVSGKTESFVYDDENRLVERIYDGVSIEQRSYDGQQQTVSRSGDITIIDFDESRRLVSWVDPLDASVSAQRIDGVLQQIVTPNRTVTFDVELGLVNRVTESDSVGTRETSFQRDASGLPILITLPDGGEQRFDYHVDGTAESIHLLLDRNQFAVSYDRIPGGQISSAANPTASHRYSYDSLGRLESESIDSGSEAVTVSYQYDASGNRTRKTVADEDGIRESVAYEYDAQSRMTMFGEATVSHDVFGNLIEIDGASSTISYAYDRADRLERYEMSSGVESEVVQYTYDFDGVLLTRTENGRTLHFVWDRFSVEIPMLAEILDDSGNLIQRFVHDGGRYLYAVNSVGDVTYYMTDHLGSVIAGYDTNGVRTLNLHTDAFGELQNPVDEFSVGFAGGLVDPTSGLVYLNARWYSPKLGRFLTQDAAGSDPKKPQTLNRYIYSLNDPVNRVDRDGFTSAPEQLTVASIIGSLAAMTAIGGAGLAVTSNAGAELISGGKTTFSFQTGKVAPFLEVSADFGISNNFVGASGGLVQGLEFVNFHPNHGYFYYIGAQGSLTGGISTSKPGASLSATAKLRSAIGNVYEATRAEDYVGWFYSLTGGFSASAQYGNSIGRGGAAAGYVKQIAWSPSPITSGRREGKYSHTRTIFKFGLSASIGEGGAVAAKIQGSIGFSGTYYVEARELPQTMIRLLKELANDLRSRG